MVKCLRCHGPMIDDRIVRSSDPVFKCLICGERYYPNDLIPYYQVYKTRQGRIFQKIQRERE